MDSIVHVGEILHVLNKNSDSLFLFHGFVSMKWNPFVCILVQILNVKHGVKREGTKRLQRDKQREDVVVLLVVVCVLAVCQ